MNVPENVSWKFKFRYLIRSQKLLESDFQTILEKNDIPDYIDFKEMRWYHA
jgi:hypothetical protein